MGGKRRILEYFAPGLTPDQFIDFLPENGFGLHAPQAVKHFAVLKKQNGRVMTNTQLAGKIIGNVNIDAEKPKTAGVLVGQLFNNGVHDGSFPQPVGSEYNEKR